MDISAIGLYNYLIPLPVPRQLILINFISFSGETLQGTKTHKRSFDAHLLGRVLRKIHGPLEQGGVILGDAPQLD
jgi:hypothetical protein